MTSKMEITVEGPIGGPDNDESLDILGGSLMEALIGLGAEDPFVSIRAEQMRLHVRVVVRATSGADGIAQASRLIESAAKQVGVDPTIADGDVLAEASARLLQSA